MGNRKAAETHMLSLIEALLGKDSHTYKVYVARLAEMSDEKFDEYMHLLKDGKEILPIWVHNYSGRQLTTARALKVAKDFGYPLFQRLWLTDQKTGQLVLRERPTRLYLVAYRRQAETVDAKIGIPKNNATKDLLTNQPTGDSKGSTWSNPEYQATFGRSLPNVNRELMGPRGGNDQQFNAMNRSILETGSVSLESLPQDHVPKAVTLTGVVLTSMHLQNNLDETS